MLNEMNFTNFADFIDQLNEVSDVTEWVRTNLDNIKLEKLDNNNPFPNFGGDAYGIGITIDDESTIPLRSTSINTLITRADVSGKGIQRVFDERKDLFCEHLNAYYALKPKKRKDCLALIQDGKLPALHSGCYAIIPLKGIFEAIENYFEDSFSKYTLRSAYWSWEYSEVDYSIQDKYFEDVYNKLSSKYFEGSSKIRLRCISSDVAEAAVRMYPYLIVNDDKFIPLAGTTATRHYGEANLSDVINNIKKTFISFEASCRSFAGLKDIKINNTKNCMIKAFTALRIPQKYAIPVTEPYNNTPSNALDIYIAMCDCLEYMKKAEIDKESVMRYEEILSKLVTYNVSKWKDMDIPGNVAWVA